MDETSSIINIGELSKPAAVLVEKIADAIGGLARPWQIRRVAEAEAEAEKIHAVAQIEITKLQRRAVTRLIAEEARKQNNIESITAKALPQLSDEAKPENLEDDWIANFFDKCRLISDDEMQRLWAKILAEETNSQGSFSKRTINLLAGLDKSEAVLFATLCRYNVTIGSPSPLVYDAQNPIYNQNGINFGSLSHLEVIGLIQFNNLTNFQRLGIGAAKGYVAYFDQNLWIELPGDMDWSLNLGRVILTSAGGQLASLCETKPVEGFAEYVQEQWKRFGYGTQPPPPVVGAP